MNLDAPTDLCHPTNRPRHPANPRRRSRDVLTHHRRPRLAAQHPRDRDDGDLTLTLMSKYDKLLFQILRGTSDANVSFDDLRHLLKAIGFEERIRGSHHMFRKAGLLRRSTYNAKVVKPRFIKCGRSEP